MGSDGLGMPLAYKPHTITLYVPTEVINETTKRVFGNLFDFSGAFSGQVTPEGSQSAYEKAGVEVSRPHLVMWDSAHDVPVGSLMECQSRYFLSRASQQIWDAEPTTAHRTVMAEEIDAGAVEAAHEDLA